MKYDRADKRVFVCRRMLEILASLILQWKVKRVVRLVFRMGMAYGEGIIVFEM